MHDFKKTVALIVALFTLTAQLAAQAEESGAFVERNNSHNEQAAED
ncbi:hypothetical protein [Pseudomonas botevensis]|nr:hypothetical protein [Pseudomonas botevensis]MBV4477573.1 hypothetical protein [Pseudomonas botevensis]